MSQQKYFWAKERSPNFPAHVFNASAICKDSPFNRRFESRKRKLLHDLQSESNVVYGWGRQIGTRRATNKFPSVRVQLVGQVVRYFPPFFVVVVVVVVCLFVCLFFFFFKHQCGNRISIQIGDILFVWEMNSFSSGACDGLIARVKKKNFRR